MLSINDKDYSITFGLYFSVEWVEPRLNLSQDVWGAGSGVGDTLVPGQQKYIMCFVFVMFEAKSKSYQARAL